MKSKKFFAVTRSFKLSNIGYLVWLSESGSQLELSFGFLVLCLFKMFLLLNIVCHAVFLNSCTFPAKNIWKRVDGSEWNVDDIINRERETWRINTDPKTETMSTVKNTSPFLYSTDFYEAEIRKCKNQTVTEC